MKYKLTTTLALLREHSACPGGYRKLLKSLGPDWPEDQPINLLRILDSNGVLDMLWCLRATVEDARVPAVLITADCAESVLHIFEARFPEDKRPRLTIAAGRDCVAGRIDTAETKRAAKFADYVAFAAAAFVAADVAFAAADVAGNVRTVDASDAAARAAEHEKQAAIIRKWLRTDRQQEEVMSDKCPKCFGPTEFLGGCSAHPSNMYCSDPKCGWRAWNTARNRQNNRRNRDE